MTVVPPHSLSAFSLHACIALRRLSGFRLNDCRVAHSLSRFWLKACLAAHRLSLFSPHACRGTHRLSRFWRKACRIPTAFRGLRAMPAQAPAGMRASTPAEASLTHRAIALYAYVCTVEPYGTLSQIHLASSMARRTQPCERLSPNRPSCTSKAPSSYSTEWKR